MKYIIDPGFLLDVIVTDRNGAYDYLQDRTVRVYRTDGTTLERYDRGIGWADIKDMPDQTPIKVLMAAGLHK